MARSVKVILVGDVGKYVIYIKEAKSATEGLDNKVEDLNRDLDKTAPAAARAAAAMKLAGGDAGGAAARFKQFSEATDDAGNSINKSVTFSKFLSAELITARNAAEDLGREFKKTGDTNVLSKLIDAKAVVKDLEKVQKGIEDAISQGGKEGSKSLLSSLQGALSTPVLGPITVAALVGAIAISAPAIGAAIGAAFIGGTGLGLIGLGIAGQINSAPVQSAFGVLKQHATDDLTAASSVFQSTLVGGVHGLTDELDHIAPDVQRNLSKIAMPTQHLFGGLADAIDRLGPGIDDLASAAAPFIDQLAMELPKFTGSLSQMFHDISGGAPGAIQFFHDLFTLIDGLVVATGKFAEAMEKAYGWLRVVSTGLAHGPMAGGDVARGLADVKGAQDAASQSAKELKVNMEVAGASLDLAGGKAMSASDQFGMLITQLNAVNNTADTVAGAMSDKLFNGMMASDQATLHWDESLTKLSTDLTKGKDSLNEHTVAGQKNIEAILAAVQANIQIYDTNIKAGMSATDAAAAYDQNTQALENQLRKAGLTQSAIDGLIGKYKSVPDNVNTDIAMNGLTQAINDLADLERAIHGLPKLTVITIEEQHRTSGVPTPGGNDNHGHATGAIRRAAVGMIVPPRNPGTLIGEPQTGGEALIPLRGISQMRAAALGQVAMGGYGLDVVPRGLRAGATVGGAVINVVVNAGLGTDGRAVGQQIANVLRPYVHGQFGGNVQAALGRG